MTFKTWRKGSGYFAALAEAVRALHRCEAVVAVPPAGVAMNAVQLLVDDEAPVLLKPAFARPNRHNSKVALTVMGERQRVSVEWRVKPKPIGRVLLLDDLTRSGATMKVYEELLKREGVAKTVVRFALAGAAGTRRFTKAGEVRFVPADDLPEMEGEAPVSEGEGRPSDALERLREVRVEIAREELARMRGELIPCATVHGAYGEVVAIVRAGLLTLPKLAAVELANQGPAAIEKWCDRWARDLADTFHERCAAVKLVPPLDETTDVPRLRPGGKAVQRGKTQKQLRG